MSRKLSIFGNWKMYKTNTDSKQFLETYSSIATQVDIQVGIAVPFTAISCCSSLAPADLLIGAQNMNDAEEGAFTGEISNAMLQDAGARFVILGHSERRQYFAETSALVAKKLDTALRRRLIPIVCIGESEEERETGFEEPLEKELRASLEGLKPENAHKVIIAYEPIWAIGTGKTASKEIAEKTHAFLRKILAQLFNDEISQKISIIYGGSVKPNNAAELLTQKNIDGALIGGASLNPHDFTKIITIAEKL